MKPLEKIFWRDIFWTPFIDLLRSLSKTILEGHLERARRANRRSWAKSLVLGIPRGIVWNALHRSWAKPPYSDFREDIWYELEERITDVGRSLLGKYFREDIWNAVYRSWAKPSGKIFQKDHMDRILWIVCEAFWENILGGSYGSHFMDCLRSLLGKYFRRITWSAIHRSSAKPSEKIFQKRCLKLPFTDARQNLS